MCGEGSFALLIINSHSELLKHFFQDICLLQLFLPLLFTLGWRTMKLHLQNLEEPRRLSSFSCDIIYCSTRLQMLALDVKLDAFETFKVAPLFDQTMLTFFMSMLGVEGMGVVHRPEMSGLLTLEAKEEVQSQLAFNVHWKCSCAAAPTIPTTVKYRSCPHCCGGLGLASGPCSFVVIFCH